MAEGTRLKDLNEHMNALESKMQTLTVEYQSRVLELTNQIKEVSNVEQKHYESILKDSTKRHEELLLLLPNHVAPADPVEKAQTSQSVPRDYPHGVGNRSVKMEHIEGKGKGLLPLPIRDFDLREEERRGTMAGKGSNSHHIPYPRLEFPIFMGEEPRVWVEHCEQYFEIYQIPQHQWMSVATMHISGRARTWKQSYLVNRQIVSWDEFIEALCRRFGQIGERYLIREFNNLKQLGTVEKYQERFEELRTQLIYHNPQLTEEHYFISCYINGLKEDLVPFMDMGHPNTLEEAYEQAKLNERALSVISRKYKSSPRTFGGSYQPNTFFKPQVLTTQKGPITNTNPSKLGGNPLPYNRSLLEQRRAAGQCFKCGDRYYPGHVCSNKPLNCMQGLEDILEVYDEGCIIESQEAETEDINQEEESTTLHEERISVHALSGVRPQDTIKIQGDVKGHALTVLIDTKSTHSFMDLQLARDLKAQLIAASPLVVTVANGQKVLSKLQCIGFKWTM